MLKPKSRGILQKLSRIVGKRWFLTSSLYRERVVFRVILFLLALWKCYLVKSFWISFNYHLLVMNIPYIMILRHILLHSYSSSESFKEWAKLGIGWAKLGHKNHLSQCNVFSIFQYGKKWIISVFLFPGDMSIISEDTFIRCSYLLS